MHKFPFLLIGVALCMLACSEKEPEQAENSFSLEGTLRNAPTPLPIYLRDLYTEQNTDSTVMTDSTFSFSGTVAYPRQFRVVYDDPNVSFSHEVWVENTDITLRADWEDMSGVQIDGGEEQAFANKLADSLDKWDEDNELPLNNPYLYDLNQEGLLELLDYRGQQRFEYWLPLVMEKADSYYGASMLFENRDLIEKQELRNAYNQMSEPVKRSPYGQGLALYLNQDSLQEGDSYVDFPLVNLEGESKRLSDYVGNGKPTLLVFGALGHIRQHHRDMIGSMHYEHGTEVNVLGYTMESSLNLFRRDTVWYYGVPLITDFEKEYSPMVIQYDAITTPTTYVFDQQGVIRLISDSYTEEANKLALELAGE